MAGQRRPGGAEIISRRVVGPRRQRGGLSQLAFFACEERGPGNSSRHVDWARVLSQTRDLFAYVWLPWELQVNCHIFCGDDLVPFGC